MSRSQALQIVLQCWIHAHVLLGLHSGWQGCKQELHFLKTSGNTHMAERSRCRAS